MSDKPQKFRSLISHGLNNTAEQPDPIRLDVHGQIPPWLSGVLYRTGPGTFSIPTKHGREWRPAHWFDGLGLNHKFDIKPNGEVWYMNRKASPEAELSVAETGTRLSFAFDNSDPCETFFQKFTTFFKRAVGVTSPRDEEGNVSVTLTPNMPGFAVPSSHSTNKVNGVEYIVVKTDADILSILDPETLKVLGSAHYADADPALKGAALSAAHACTDPINGDLFNHVYKFGSSAGYTAFRIRGKGPGRGNFSVLANITDAPPAYLHSSCLTEKYFILCIWQADIKWHGLTIPFHRNLMDAIGEWDPKREALFYVIDREAGGIVAKYKTDPYFCFHTINAYDEGDDVIIDLAAYDDHSILYTLKLDNMRFPLEYPHAAKSSPKRFLLAKVSTIPKGIVAPAQTVFYCAKTKVMELPTVHPAKYHRKYRYCYGISMGGGPEAVISDEILKLDMDHPDIESAEIRANGSGQVWREDGCVPGEPIFVPRPGGTEEDDGAVLTVVLDSTLLKSKLVILDAKTMKEIARAEMKTIFPIGFHGTFVKAAL